MSLYKEKKVEKAGGGNRLFLDRKDVNPPTLQLLLLSLLSHKSITTVVNYSANNSHYIKPISYSGD